MFVTVGIGYRTIGYSNDGIRWYNVSNNILTNGTGVAYYNGLWVATGTGNSLAYSHDGIIWNGLGTDIFTINGYNVCWTDLLWVAVGQGQNTIAYSYDGISWTGIGSNIFSLYGRGVAGTRNMIIAVGLGINNIAYSYDAINWIGLGNIIMTEIDAVVTNKIIWLIFGRGINTIAYSFNGIDWFGVGNDIFSDNGIYAAWNGTMWVAVGGGTNTIAYSYDGIHWIGLGNIIFSDYGRCISWNGTMWIAGGDVLATSYDGINWVILSNSLNITTYYSITSSCSYDFPYQDQVINFGNYNILPGGLYSINYYITYQAELTEILQAQLMISHVNYHKIYDSLPFINNAVTYTGFENIDSSFNLIGQLTYYPSPIDVGTYYISASGLIGYNYSINYIPGQIIISKAPLVIRCDNHIKEYDKIFYTPTYSVYGLLGNDTINSLSGFIVYSGTYINALNVGSYTMIPSGFTSSNYDIKYINGTLKIVPSYLMIIANNTSRIYDSDISGFRLVYNPNYIGLISSFTGIPIPSYTNIESNGIITFTDDNRTNRIWSLEGFQGPCYLSFRMPPIGCSIGLSEINYNYPDISSTSFNEYIIYNNKTSTLINYTNNIKNIDSINNRYNYSITTTYNTFDTGFIDPSGNILINYDGTDIKFYINSNLILTTQRLVRKKLYINIFTTFANQYIYNINFNSIQEYYNGGNGFYIDGLQGDDTVISLSGNIIYGGTSQNASIPGIYSIIPSGLSSINYSIKYINGSLNIRKSIQ